MEIGIREGIIADVNNRMDELYKLYPQLVDEIFTVKKDLNDNVQKLLALISEINVNLLRYATKEEVEAKFTLAYEEWKGNIETLKTDIRLLYSYIALHERQVYSYIDSQDSVLLEKIEKIQLNPVQKVVSPITHETVDIQVALDQLYCNLYFTLSEIWGLTAREYTYLYITAEQYDEYGLEAIQYDLVGKWYLYPWEYKQEYPMGLESEEYDSLEITAETYDNANLSAKHFDQRGLWYFGSYPFETQNGVAIKSKLRGDI